MNKKNLHVSPVILASIFLLIAVIVFKGLEHLNVKYSALPIYGVRPLSSNQKTTTELMALPLVLVDIGLEKDKLGSRTEIESAFFPPVLPPVKVKSKVAPKAPPKKRNNELSILKKYMHQATISGCGLSGVILNDIFYGPGEKLPIFKIPKFNSKGYRVPILVSSSEDQIILSLNGKKIKFLLNTRI